MNLSEEDKKSVASWVAEGASLAEVQRRLKEELGVSVTYMDVRFLVDDLKLQLKEQPKQSEAVERLAAAKQEGESARSAPPAGGVSVTMDTITKPHALASGTVTFSDGESADWMLDQTGRLGLNPTKPGYRPSQTDVMAFQQELQRVAQGF
jgi:transposase